MLRRVLIGLLNSKYARFGNLLVIGVEKLLSIQSPHAELWQLSLSQSLDD